VQHVLITLEIERRLPLRLRKSWANVHVFNATLDFGAHTDYNCSGAPHVTQMMHPQVSQTLTTLPFFS
jgi:hypothetical protein